LKCNSMLFTLVFVFLTNLNYLLEIENDLSYKEF